MMLPTWLLAVVPVEMVTLLPASSALEIELAKMVDVAPAVKLSA
ncbi:hypothetical protein [Limnohabitans sp. G3-2]|nr:hypothetical protein [Limnohabitans sp. G3-2]